MARPGITLKEVSAVASAIKARGQTPTIAAIRNELGNTGSFTTIAQHLASWKQEAAMEAETDTPLPEAVENEALKAIAAVWRIATNVHREELAAMRAAHEDEKKALQTELAEAHEYIKEKEKSEEELTQKNAQQEQELKAAADEHMRLIGTINGLQGVIEQLKNTFTQRAKQPQASDTKQGKTQPSKA